MKGNVDSEPFDLPALQASAASGQAQQYLFFWGHSSDPGRPLGKECLSQWYPAPFSLDGVEYRTAEHYMMTQKALLFGDTRAAEQIRACGHPAEAKELGRHVRGFDNDRWEEHRFAIVAKGSHGKFSQNAELRAFLVATRPRVLVEASPKDTIWGIGLGEKDPRAKDPNQWRGLNLLGFALIHARALLAAEGPNP